MESVELNLPSEKIEELLGTVTSPAIVLSELIKNSVDSNADNINVNIFKEESKIVIEDDGDGFTIDDIKKLAVISESNKKEGNELSREDGDYLTGSKGLGILSTFSITNKLTMYTQSGGERYYLEWIKGNKSFQYIKVEKVDKNGSKIIIEDVSKEYLTILTDEEEINKLKHISILNYEDGSLDNKNINFYIDDIMCKELKIKKISQLRSIFDVKVEFKYISKDNKILYKYKSRNSSISPKEIEIKLDNEVNIREILSKEYNINVFIGENPKLNYLNFGLEDFYGCFWVKNGAIARPMKTYMDEFGHGVKIFVNQFAMYGYLEAEKDWLNFADLSMVKKATSFKPHNVFGFVHFKNLNEKECHIKISNERAYFIENTAFKKLIEIMKNIVTEMSFSIDVAIRNGWFHIPKERKAPDAQKPPQEKQGVGNENNQNPPEDKEGEKNNPQDNHEGKDENKDGESKEDENKDNLDGEEENKKKEKQKDQVKMLKKSKFTFFKTSNVIKSPTHINLEYNELIDTLKKLDYSEYPLVYVIAFRCLVEDISKRYLNVRGIKLDGDFGRNVKNLVDDALKILKFKQINSAILSEDEKTRILNIFGGYNAFNNNFSIIGSDFHDGAKPQKNAKKLNAITHTPQWMEVRDAEHMANDVILPLYVFSCEIIKILTSNTN